MFPLEFILAWLIVVLILVVGVFIQEWWENRREKRRDLR